MLAHCLIRSAPFYRHEAFVAGLRAAGLKTVSHRPNSITRDTLIVIWNRYAEMNALAEQVERAGGTVIVAENGYIAAEGGVPKFQVHPAGPQPHHYYSVTRSFHNTDTLVQMGATDRFAPMGIALKPWREEGEYVLVCPNRSFGAGDRMMPPDWSAHMVRRLRKLTEQPIMVRPHPGNSEPRRPLSVDLAGARVVVIWSSSCGVHALAEGIPVICCAPHWICKGATFGIPETDATDHELRETREQAFQRLAWAQWTVEEITNGDPFRHLLYGNDQR